MSKAREENPYRNLGRTRKNVKSDKRRKGFKPPFNRNEPNRNHQDHYAKGESKKEDSLGKRGRPPIQF